MAATATEAKKPVSKATAKKLREERADLIQKCQLYVTEHEDEQGLLSAEDQQTVTEMLAKAGQLNQQAECREDLEQAVDGLSKPVGQRLAVNISRDGGVGGDGAAAQSETILVRHGLDGGGKPRYRPINIAARGEAAYRDTFDRYLMGGALTSDEYAALQSDNAEQAGYLVASEQFASELLKAVDDNVIIRQFANIHTVREARSLGIRARTAKASTFTWSSELGAPTADAALKYGKRVLEPHYLSGSIDVSRDLLRLSVVPVDQEVRGELARDAGEVQEQAFMTGNGAQRPLGLFIASADGISTARDASSGSATKSWIDCFGSSVSYGS